MRKQDRRRMSGALLLLIVLALGAPSRGRSSPQEDTVRYEQLPPEGGEHCLICGMELTANDVVLIYRGRKVPLLRKMVETFVQDPDRYFFKLEPRAALFDEHAVVRRKLSLGWLLFGLWMVASLFFAGLSAHAAVLRGFAPLPWFFLGLFGNVFGYLVLLGRKSRSPMAPQHGWTKVHVTSEPVYCSGCGAEMHPSARRCPFCGKESSPASVSEVERVRRSSEANSP